ncbi:hypothetical protein C2S52_008925 [Perilla frutescens var. hirtella]|nr:hypothetical protein C2S52_008925 [Perilla frutescens var. hirtella]
MSLVAARSHLRLLAAAIPLSRSSCGSRAIATSSQTDQQEGNNKSTWTKIKIFFLPAFFFCAGTERVFSLREKSELAEQWESRLKMETLNGNEIDPSLSESLETIEFRKVSCKGVFDESNSILVLENIPTPSDPFAYQYSLLTPFIPLPAHPRSVRSPLLVNRGRVPRDWADYRKIEKFQSHEIERLNSTVSRPQPVESVGVIRSIILKLQRHLSSVSWPRPRPQPLHRSVELLGVIRSGVYSEWLSINVGMLAHAVGLDPKTTLYVEQIQDMSSNSANTVATPYHDADMLGRFAMMRKEHMEMILIWYCCSAGAFYLARWLMRKPL